MRFGSFCFPCSQVPENDSVVIDNTLREVELVEEVGFDAVWLNEHHFDGASAYADPLVFAGAVAARTQRIKIGFAVLEMALHHPVRLAAQTALLDNLSHGRLIVGIGRGSAFNHYEYIGFGTTMEQGMESLAEAEELLVKAWTSEDVRHEGKFWNLSFPILRPRPYQKPHPPMVRACISEASVVEMAKIGRPVLTAGNDGDAIRQRLELYHETMLDSGFDEGAAEKALDETWVTRDLFVAETSEEAREIASAGMETEQTFFRLFREKHNPKPTEVPEPARAAVPEKSLEQVTIYGTATQVADQVAELRDAGVRNLMLKVNTGETAPEHVESSVRLFGEKVLPLFK